MVTPAADRDRAVEDDEELLRCGALLGEDLAGLDVDLVREPTDIAQCPSVPSPAKSGTFASIVSFSSIRSWAPSVSSRRSASRQHTRWTWRSEDARARVPAGYPAGMPQRLAGRLEPAVGALRTAMADTRRPSAHRRLVRGQRRQVGAARHHPRHRLRAGRHGRGRLLRCSPATSRRPSSRRSPACRRRAGRPRGPARDQHRPDHRGRRYGRGRRDRRAVRRPRAGRRGSRQALGAFTRPLHMGLLPACARAPSSSSRRTSRRVRRKASERSSDLPSRACCWSDRTARRDRRGRRASMPPRWSALARPTSRSSVDGTREGVRTRSWTRSVGRRPGRRPAAGSAARGHRLRAADVRPRPAHGADGRRRHRASRDGRTGGRHAQRGDGSRRAGRRRGVDRARWSARDSVPPFVGRARGLGCADRSHRPRR